ncbi:MAG: arginine decarboxylase, pyruvoyl-dependent [Methanobrevibacter sp.]|jgi:arginine decarboxylase|nr:arginine decarboxylase, pyruvoyl-dependent [Candidatus Methanoflexus mossambicus]
MEIAIVSGKSEGPTKLNAFDNALRDAGIGDVNLIKVSSMLTGETKIKDLPKLEAGKMVNCVLSNLESENNGDLIVAVVAIAIGDELGCVVENKGINVDIEELKLESEKMVKYMMNVRGVEIKKLLIEEIHHKVDNIGSVVASVVYLD